MENIYRYFNCKIRQVLEKYEIKNIYEIRIRVNKNVILNTGMGEIILDVICNEKDVIDTFNLITEYSAYAYEQSMAEGFITIPGGHRVGIGGYLAGTIYDKPIIRNIRFINFRINHHIKKCSEMIFPKLYKNNHLCNTLIISPPGLGKTTLLRDLVYKISENFAGTSLCVIDERNEISGCYKGVPTMDLGKRTDVISNCSKSKGILMAIRSMAPTLIAVDEIGTAQDIEALEYANLSGIFIIATVHGKNQAAVIKKLGKDFVDLFEKKICILNIGEYLCI